MAKRKGMRQPRFVQGLNPKTQTYVKIDKLEGRIVSHHPRKNTPYKGVPIIGDKESSNGRES